MTRAELLAKGEEFFLKPASAMPLAAVRIAIGICLLVQSYLLRGSVADFFSRDGLVQGELARALNDPSLPQLSWLTGFMTNHGIGEMTYVNGVCSLYVIAVILLTLGFRTRLSSIVAWFLHWVLMNTGSTTAYGVDLYAHVFLFYLMFMPAGDALSIDGWLRGEFDRPSSAARLGLRVLQLHLCIAYFTSAMEKSAGIQWWNGEVIWRSLTLPLYRQYDFDWLARFPLLAALLGWGALALEFGYSIFIWPRATRRYWILGIVGLHVGISIFLGLGLFGMVMAVLTPAVFGISAEPRGEALILYDGLCKSCDAFVNFVLERDGAGRFKFASLQSDYGKNVLASMGLQGSGIDSMVLIEARGTEVKSRAVLAALAGLGGAWSAAWIFSCLPHMLTDFFYDVFARHRYRWFGSMDRCRVLSGAEQRRFLG